MDKPIVIAYRLLRDGTFHASHGETAAHRAASPAWDGPFRCRLSVVKGSAVFEPLTDQPEDGSELSAGLEDDIEESSGGTNPDTNF